jgi:hypothetical protein
LSAPEIDTNRCPECGAAVAAGRAGCQALYDAFAAQAYGDLAYASLHDLAFDTYCMQHPDTYCRSAKSYAAHLTRLCCGLEHGSAAGVYAAIQIWLNGSVALEKPAVPPQRGAITIVDVAAAHTNQVHRRLVQSWAENVWAAYAHQHELARAWVLAAISGKKVDLHT